MVADGAGILVPADDACVDTALFDTGLDVVVVVGARAGGADERAVGIDELLPVRDVEGRAIDVRDWPDTGREMTLDATARDGTLC